VSGCPAVLILLLMEYGHGELSVLLEIWAKKTS